MSSPTDGSAGPSTYASNVVPAPVPAPVAAPSTKPGPNPRSRMTLLNKKHSQPLPITLPSLPKGSSASSPSSSSTYSTSSSTSILSSFVPSFLARTASRGIELPTCIGTYDAPTRSVWVTDSRSKEILFNSGFFGKGTLSRSEPSWRQRRVDLLKGGESLMAEQIREKRRIERKQFKIDRAAAMLDAAKTAEAVLVSGLTAATPTAVASSSGGGSPATGLQRQLSGLEGEGEADRDAFADGYGENETATSTPIPVEEDGAVSSIPPSPAPSASSNAVLDYTSLTPQTFLVRPTRPDANRNRGRKAFKRRPPPQKPQSQPQPGSQPSQPPSTMNPDVAGPAVPSVDTAGPGTASSSSLPSAGPSAGRSDATGIDVTIPPTMSQEPHNENDEEEDEVLARGEEIEEMVEEMEHLQLGAEEAWFLAAGLGVLKVYDPATDSYPPLPALLPLFLTPLEPPSPTTLALMPTPPPMYPDDPFLVSYVAYHHYRSLGWVVKPGIKFCCDWLLYRRGPAFSHSAFSLLLIPVPAASSPSPHALSDYYADRLSWKWINTVMRVNSLVQKTVILVYVTIPSIKDFPASARTTEGALDFGRIGIRGLLERYAINEVSLTRFGPARRRD